MKVTSRGRPTELIKAIKSYVDLAADTQNMVWLFSFDEDDKDYYKKEFVEQIGHIVPGSPSIIFGTSTDKINAINRDVNEFYRHWDVLLNISDDQLPIVKGYDEYIRRAFYIHGLDKSLWFHDGHQYDISTQEIVGRTYYERDRFIYDPRFKSFFCDNWSNYVARARGCQIRNPKCIIKHLHPAWEKSTHMTNDFLYQRNNKFWDQDRAMFHKIKSTL